MTRQEVKEEDRSASLRYYHDNHERVKSRQLAWHHANKEKVKAYRQATARKHAFTPEEWQLRMDKRKAKLYGMSLERYHELKSKICCDVCKKLFDSSRSRNVDHDHDTGSIRGLLCQNCNLMIGHALDDPELLRKAALYLESKAHEQNDRASDQRNQESTNTSPISG